MGCATARPAPESDGVDREALSRFVKANRGPVVACYDRELKSDPSLKGKVVVFFVITPEGRAGHVEIQENTVNAAVGECVKPVVQGWEFPFKPDADVPVAIPFVFSTPPPPPPP